MGESYQTPEGPISTIEDLEGILSLISTRGSLETSDRRGLDEAIDNHLENLTHATGLNFGGSIKLQARFLKALIDGRDAMDDAAMKALGAYRPLDELISSALGTLKRHTGGQVKDGGQEQAKDEGAPKAKDKGKDKIHVKKESEDKTHVKKDSNDKNHVKKEPHGPLKGLPDMQPFNVNGKDLNVPKSKALAQDYDDYWFTNEGGS